SAARPNSAASSASQLVNGRTVLLVRRVDHDRLLVFAASPAFVSREWRSAWGAESAAVSLVDPGGQVVLGTVAAAGQAVAMLNHTETGLPWTVQAVDQTTAAQRAAVSSRRWLIGAALVVLILLIPTGGYVVARAVQKELAVARLQADFVSAV